MTELTFTLDHAEGACGHGISNARAIFEHGRAYSLREMIADGLPIHDLVWLLFHRAKRDSATMPVLIAWAGRCKRAQGLRGKPPQTAAECSSAIKESVKAWARGKPTSKGGRQWAYGVLLDLINEGEF